MSLFTAADEQRISAAITDAEKRTSGEIVVVVTGQSDGYHYVPPLVGAAVALLVPWVLIYFTQLHLVPIYLIQLATFLIVTLAMLPLAARIAPVPSSIRWLHAHRRAVEQFLAQNLHTTDGRTGVLLFVSVAERYAEIIADKSIDGKVPAGTWKSIIDGLTTSIDEKRTADGFVEAIGAIGTALAANFPPGASDPNELPDHLIILQ
jgi:putative membrane protein